MFTPYLYGHKSPWIATGGHVFWLPMRLKSIKI
jgi:hypothetical protein